MTILLYMPDGVASTAMQERQAKAATHGGGSGRPLGGRSGFRVDTPANVLTVTTTSWTLLPCSAMIDPGASTHQGMYGWASDANITGTPTPPDATLPRKDIYYIRVNDSTSGDGSGEVNANVYYLAGTPSAATPLPAPTLPARSFLIGTVTVPQNGGGAPTVVLNPARYVAAGAPLPVYSQAERDALVAHDGLIVQRRDIAGRPIEAYSGSAWTASDVPLTTIAPIPAHLFAAVTTGGWGGIKYSVRNSTVFVGGAVTRGTSWGADQDLVQMPAGLYPPFKVQGVGCQVGTNGILTIPAGGVAASFSASWTLI